MAKKAEHQIDIEDADRRRRLEALHSRYTTQLRRQQSAVDATQAQIDLVQAELDKLG